MNEMPLLGNYFPDGQLDGGIRLLNRLDWGLRVRVTGKGWVVTSGEQLVFRTTEKDALQAFLYGLGLAYAVLPDETFLRLEAELKSL